MQSGRSAELGIEPKCRGEDLPLLTATIEHQAACHLVPLGLDP
jgi:hypothetical protein